MFYKVLIVFFVILILLFGCLIFTVHDRHQRPILCHKLAEKWVCEKEADCPSLHELVKDYEIHHCGKDGHESKICCPPHDHHKHAEEAPPEQIPGFKTKNLQVRDMTLHPDPVTIVRQKCREYAEFTLINQTIESQLPDEEAPIQHQIRECVEVEPLIVGGVNATEKEFPHMALLGFGETIEETELSCGGSLISEEFILTAAHCTPENTTGGGWALLGSLTRLDALSINEDKNVFRTVEHINHPEYKTGGKSHDIALYRLERPIKFTPHIRPICIIPFSLEASKSTIEDDETATITGWGTTDPGFPLSDYLLKATIRILNDDECKSDSSYSNIFNSETMICAGNIEKRKDTCWGDSGGPLQVPTPDLECMWTEIGITSHGYSECGSGPAIYTKVSYFIPWIQKIVWP